MSSRSKPDGRHVALVDVDEVLVDPAVGLGAVGVEGLPVGAAADVLHFADAAALGLRAAVTELGGSQVCQRWAGSTTWSSTLMIFGQRGGAAEARGGVVDEIGHGAPVWPQTRRGAAKCSSWARMSSATRPGSAGRPRRSRGRRSARAWPRWRWCRTGRRRAAAGSRPACSASSRRRGIASPSPPPPIGQPAVGVRHDGREDRRRGRRRRSGCARGAAAPAWARTRSAPKSTNSPWNSACSVDQMRLHGRQVLAHDKPAAAEVDAVILRLGPVPADARPRA